MFDYSGFREPFKCMAVSFPLGFILRSIDRDTRCSATGNDAKLAPSFVTPSLS